MNTANSTSPVVAKAVIGLNILNVTNMSHIFYGCNKYPDCDFVLWDEPTGNKCPECGELLVKKKNKNGTFEVCSSRKCGFKRELTLPEQKTEE